ncbi:MAG: CoA transferase, partial [Actinobacteria bacterium]|nr:CoA transferase [Actinomycetota bacterium]
MSELLSDIRVLDLTLAWAGPHATALLADLGAEVIRVESSARVDLQRIVSPFFPNIPAPEAGGWQALHNRRKLSCAINLKSREGVEITRRLAAKSDIVVENFRPGVMKGLGLGFDDLVQVAPNIVYVSLCGYGPGGEMADCGSTR